jgi:Kelch motif.
MNALFQLKKRFPPVRFFTPRTLVALLLCGTTCLIVTGNLPAFYRLEAQTKVPQTTITFAERVAYQRVIEDVYWRHRIWPKENPNPKPALDAVVSQTQLEKKVEDYLRNSQALEDFWQRPITGEQLQAEMDRMAKNTKQPEVLRELFAALGDDPFVIAECLARPAVAQRLIKSWYAYDERIHGELKQRAETDLLAHPTVRQMKQNSGRYSEIELIKSDSDREQGNRQAEPGVKLNSQEWDESVQKLAAMLNGRNSTIPTSGAPIAQIRTEVVSTLQEDESRYYATAVIEKTRERLKLATVTWPKEPFESWIGRGESQWPKEIVAATANYTLPTISDAPSGCIDDTWASTSIEVPNPRYFHTAVWTGSEVIAWGGHNDVSAVNTGERYNPSTDTWTGTSLTNAPSGRYFHTAVWSGSEMIVWGGINQSSNYVNTGGRYNPSTDTWTSTASRAPIARAFHTAVWTGHEMIVLGRI